MEVGRREKRGRMIDVIGGALANKRAWVLSAQSLFPYCLACQLKLQFSLSL